MALIEKNTLTGHLSHAALRRCRLLAASAICAGLLTTLVGAGVAVAADAYSPVTDARLNAAGSSNGWLTYRHDYKSSGYSPLTQITPANVTQLKQVWDFKSGMPQGHESPAIVNGNWLYITTPKDGLYAFEASSGKLLWHYQKDLSHVGLKTVCCDVVNRGVALYGDMVYMATLDNYVVALDARTGKQEWATQLTAPDLGVAMTVAPLALKGEIIVGTSGGEYGARGRIVALDAKSGKVLWTTYTIPSPSEKGGNTWPKGAYKSGGGATWLTGTYDADTDTLFWGVGNPGPWFSKLRPGKNLYTDSVIALDPKTGHIKWYYQYTPNDSWDYDGVNETVMTTLTYEGKSHKAIVTASRNGWFYAIDRVTGKLIYAKRFVTATSVTGPNAKGQMTTDPKLFPTLDKQVFTCPSFLGGKNWWPIAVDTKEHLAFVPAMHTCMDIKGAPVSYKAGLPFLGESFNVMRDPKFPHIWGEVQAIDLNTGEQVWRFPSKLPWNDGLLVTASGLVISGSAGGHLYAFDEHTGKVLWKSPQLSSGVLGVPTTWKVDGKQYVSVWTGWGGASPIWGGDMAKDPAVKAIPHGGHFYVFALPNT
jgi:alcohol dehydrogenase (cytochrome c)